MEGVFFGGSLFAAFVAGAVALFAPCCIVFMFPAYLAAAVRNRRWRLVPLTLVFAAGIAAVANRRSHHPTLTNGAGVVAGDVEGTDLPCPSQHTRPGRKSHRLDWRRPR